MIKPDISPLLGNRSLRRIPFDLVYYPANPKDNETLMDVGEQLMDVMEFITLPDGSMLRGSGISYQIIDDLLHFFVSYNHTVCRKVENEPMMEEATIYGC